MPKPKPPSLQAANAIAEIDAIMVKTLALGTPTIPTTDGKLYELCAVARLLSHLMGRGWIPSYTSPQITLKAAPGGIKPGDPHFELRRQPGGPIVAEIHVDVQVRTLGAEISAVNDRSGYHEIDIVVVPHGVRGMPRPAELLLGIECKATANFDKAFVREVLGRRRELSFFSYHGLPCLLDASVEVPADPPSEYWLVFIDPAGVHYRQSPAAFGVMLHQWTP